jgi:septal ring factor EnvC (AmiA/AmiB activator)
MGAAVSESQAGWDLLLQILQRTAESGAQTSADLRVLSDSFAQLAGKVDVLLTQNQQLIEERRAADERAAEERRAAAEAAAAAKEAAAEERKERDRRQNQLLLAAVGLLGGLGGQGLEWLGDMLRGIAGG